ncbi:MAG: TatD family hydrolase [Chloroflexota bacterium]|nr:TatD family hydrolase [Chloroflexota bacterium]
MPSPPVAPPAAPSAPLVDTHVHLTDRRYAGDLDAVLARAREAGVRAMVVVGYDLPSSREAVGLASRYPELWAAVGIHPHGARNASPAALADLESLAESPKVVAIGECGLDFYRDLSPRDAQREAFLAQLYLAQRRRLPVVVHSREAMPLTLELLMKQALLDGGVMHCFDGTTDDGQRAIDLGLYLSCAGPLTYRRDPTLAQALAAAPLERLVVETDCPYLSPHGHRGERNEPAHVREVAAALARTRGLRLTEVAAATTANAARLFCTPALATAADGRVAAGHAS